MTEEFECDGIVHPIEVGGLVNGRIGKLRVVMQIHAVRWWVRPYFALGSFLNQIAGKIAEDVLSNGVLFVKRFEEEDNA